MQGASPLIVCVLKIDELSKKAKEGATYTAELKAVLWTSLCQSRAETTYTLKKRQAYIIFEKKQTLLRGRG